MIRILLFCLYILPTLSFGQINKEELIKSIEENVNKVNLDSIAHTLGYKKGDLVRVSTMFTINESGNIEQIVARGPHDLFEKEATRILSGLPKMDPAIVDGKPQSIRFALPINFKITSKPRRGKRKKG